MLRLLRIIHIDFINHGLKSFRAPALSPSPIRTGLERDTEKRMHTEAHRSPSAKSVQFLLILP